MFFERGCGCSCLRKRLLHTPRGPRARTSLRSGLYCFCITHACTFLWKKQCRETENPFSLISKNGAWIVVWWSSWLPMLSNPYSCLTHELSTCIMCLHTEPSALAFSHFLFLANIGCVGKTGKHTSTICMDYNRLHRRVSQPRSDFFLISLKDWLELRQLVGFFFHPRNSFCHAN